MITCEWDIYSILMISFLTLQRGRMPLFISNDQEFYYWEFNDLVELRQELAFFIDFLSHRRSNVYYYWKNFITTLLSSRCCSHIVDVAFITQQCIRVKLSLSISLHMCSHAEQNLDLLKLKSFHFFQFGWAVFMDNKANDAKFDGENV